MSCLKRSRDTVAMPQVAPAELSFGVRFSNTICGHYGVINTWRPVTCDGLGRLSYSWSARLTELDRWWPMRSQAWARVFNLFSHVLFRPLNLQLNNVRTV
jgi:hypothetical protein